MAARIMTHRVTLCAVAAALSVLGACTDTKPAMTPDGKVVVTLRDKVFNMDLADDRDEQQEGLGGVTEIKANEGMLFVFPGATERFFVMRDCVIPIDIAYLDDTKRIVSMHTMQPEEPRRDDEAEGNYEARLKRYPSRYPARYVLEFRAGTLEALGVSNGDEVRFEVPASSR